MASLAWYETLGYWASALVVIGCAGEAVHEFTSWFGEFDWWRKSGGKASALLLVAALAMEIPIQLTTNSKSGIIIAFLRDEAAREERNLNALEKPRSLDSKQQAAISAAVQAFHSIPWDASIIPTSDAIDLVQQLAAALKKGGWERRAVPFGFKLSNGDPIVGLAVRNGTVVAVANEKAAEWGPAATALAKALTDQGIPATAEKDPNLDVSAVHVLIGAKL